MNPIRLSTFSPAGLLAVVMVITSMAVATDAEARDDKRGATRTNVNNNTNSNRNTNVNVNSNRRVDVDIDVDNHHHPIGTAVAIGATVAVTAAIVGSVTYTLPPACTVVIVNGITYQQCGSTWYQPQYVGTSVQYVVVAPLR